MVHFSGCAVDSWKSHLTSFHPTDFDLALNLFELGIARDEFGLAGLGQRGGKDAGARYVPVDVVSKNLSLMQLAQKLRTGRTSRPSKCHAHEYNDNVHRYRIIAMQLYITDYT